MKKIAGILLAGGYSRRFGKPKAFVKKDGKYFFQYSLDVLNKIADPVVIVTNEKLESLFREKTTVPIYNDIDSYKGKGPLAGIYTAMSMVEAEWYAVAPVDTPFITEDIYIELMKEINDENKAIIAVTDEHEQPLIALYHYSLKEVIEQLLKENRLSIKALLNQTQTAYKSFTELDSFININLQSEYERYINDGS
ncbi:molybdenum cofactor guanylyltransferase [Oceanobacillus sp. CAU 1775]